MEKIDQVKEASFLRACRGEKTEQTPVWFMRQAGRYLPEYRAVRAKHSMLDVINTPELATEVTLQPIRRFGFDAAIIFADILNPLIGMGIDLQFVEGEGPKISNPITSIEDIDKLEIPDVEINSAGTLQAIKLVRQELIKTGTPLIGFSGAPFTLSSYMIDGSSSTSLAKTKKLMYEDPEAWLHLQEKLVSLVSTYLIAQAQAGAQALQIFDSWLGFLGPAQFEIFVKPYLRQIVEKVKQATDVPLIFFATGISGLFPHLTDMPFDVLGVDWRISLPIASALVDDSFALQGNLDPLLLASGGSILDQEVLRILREGAQLESHIFNLGHGILPHTPIQNVERVLSLIRSQPLA